jgi:regulator of cell morphogenesis and NO signaling
MSELVINPGMRVSEVAARYPQALRMLEALGIDYCCGGKRPLAEAAALAKVPVETAITVLQTAITQAAAADAGERDWTRAALDDLMAHIVEKHHTYTRGELPRLEKMAALVAHVHGPNHGDVLVPLVQEYARLKAELDRHLEKEEAVVFPALARLAAGQENDATLAALHELETEHDTAGEALATMRALTDNYTVPEDGCTTYAALYDGLQALERDLHQHIHLENNILIPQARALAGTGRSS